MNAWCHYSTNTAGFVIVFMPDWNQIKNPVCWVLDEGKKEEERLGKGFFIRTIRFVKMSCMHFTALKSEYG